MNRSSAELGVLGVLTIRAAELDSPEAIAEWLRAAGTAERSRQVSAMSKDKLAHFVSLLDSGTGPELLARGPRSGGSHGSVGGCRPVGLVVGSPRSRPGRGSPSQGG